ncbi:hypothetical protein SARC_15339 [Sphaeroforma arctica JP610]|uniref:Uncharacterized protein n=1 Tax=Sphaeroforma arctica JP610 TaxID=667725 RepID=A0A0L0F5W5_9EUKA|nr:hypothetical protein SARC_15339 [Sphaeroforma arctica JP610]KNC72112.1 hypothetical protein SARC_15339 [Sphaeroforma arctica JP610]|eukprot:XP_014146014.1 hypothetical protein SARC_15339 [Sphaeroforma arctica JP610]
MFSVYLLGFFRQSWRDQIPTRNQFRKYISEHVCSCFKSSRAHSSTASSSDNIHLMQDEDRDIDAEDELLTASPDTESSVNFNSIACATDEIKGETSLVPMTFMEVGYQLYSLRAHSSHTQYAHF